MGQADVGPCKTQHQHQHQGRRKAQLSRGYEVQLAQVRRSRRIYMDIGLLQHMRAYRITAPVHLS